MLSLLYMLEGDLLLAGDCQRTITLNKQQGGFLYLSPQGQQLTIQAGNYHCLQLKFRSDYVQALAGQDTYYQDFIHRTGNGTETLLLHYSKLTVNVRKLLRKLETVRMSAQAGQILRIYATRILLENMETGTNTSDADINPEQFITDNLHRKLEIAEIARHCNRSPRSLHRWFLIQHHQTPYQYVEQLRCDKAMTAICTTQEPIMDIAWSLGFEDISTFYKAFKRRFGKAPGYFRKEH
jgi:AraC-like DNA-binding protein